MLFSRGNIEKAGNLLKAHLLYVGIGVFVGLGFQPLPTISQPTPFTYTVPDKHPPYVGAIKRIGVTQKPESEIYAAINPLDTSNILVAGMRYHPQNPEINLSFPLYRSMDFGESWIENNFDGSFLFQPINGGGDPTIAFDSHGTAHFTWLMYQVNGANFTGEIGIYYAQSTNQGRSWEAFNQPIASGKVSLDTQAGTLNAIDQVLDKPWVVVDDTKSPYTGKVYVTYFAVGPQGLGDQHLYCLSKAANASRFSTSPVQIHATAYEDIQFATADVDSEGGLHICFYGKRFGSSPALYHTVSHDGGESFSTERRISPIAFPQRRGVTSFFPSEVIGWDRAYPAPILQVDTSNGPWGGSIYVAWNAYGTESFETEGLNIYLSYSRDGGQTWSEARVINSNSQAHIHQHHPSLAVSPKGQVVTTWYDRRIDPQSNQYALLYMAISQDGGETFSSQFPVSDFPLNFRTVGAKNFGFGVGEYHGLLTTPSHAIPIWADGIEDNGTPHIFSKKITLPPLNNFTTHTFLSISDSWLKGPYPNPLLPDAKVHFHLSHPSATSLNFQLEDPSGRILHQFSHSNNSEMALSLSDYSPGVYLLRVSHQKKTLDVRKLVK